MSTALSALGYMQTIQVIKLQRLQRYRNVKCATIPEVTVKPFPLVLTHNKDHVVKLLTLSFMDSQTFLKRAMQQTTLNINEKAALKKN